MMPFAKMKSALPEPSGFAAARLLDFSEFQSGAFKADAFGVGGVFRFFPFGHPPFFALRRAALALASEVARPPRRPRACAALFIFSAGSRTRCNFARGLHGPHRWIRQVFDVLRAELCRFIFAGESSRLAFEDGDLTFLGEEEVEFSAFAAGGYNEVFHDGGENSEPLGYCKGKVKNLLGGGGGSETSCPNPCEKSNGELNGTGEGRA